MAIVNCLQNPPVWSYAVWDGTNATEMNTLLTAPNTGWSFSTDNGGTAVGHFYNILVPVGSYVAIQHDPPYVLTSAQFSAQFSVGSHWTVAP